MDTWHEVFRTKSGVEVTVRRLLPREAHLLVDLFAQMGPDSRYRRFHQPLSDVSDARIWEEACRIANADPRTNICLIALVDLPDQPGAPVAAARCVGTAPGEAEVAISVRDDMQRAGIGTVLINMLAQQALEAGFTRLVAAIQNDNLGIWRVFDRLPYTVIREPEGSFSNVIILLTTPRPDKPAAVNAARLYL